MDAFEHIRRVARRLHDRAVVDGTDPLDPSAMAFAAARCLDIEVTLLPSGDPMLKGARALFDEQGSTISCESIGTQGERATLIAHELGHAQIHAVAACCDGHDIDGSRSMEMAPVGLQRVEDYGARERRELQANVFAREFVLPRPLARRLFLDEAMGAAAIAEQMGIPTNLVRQQLFDALLLPEAPPSEIEREDPPPALIPDPSQDKAAGHRGTPYQLQAGPGTGKTRTLVKRVLSLLSDNADPSSILVLTFSNRAAGELSERLAAAAPHAASRIWVGTFHAFGLDLVRRHHDRLGLPPDPALFDRSDAIEVLEEILPTLPLKHYRNLWDPAMELREIVGAISRAKDEMADPLRYRSLSERMLDEATDDVTRVAAEKCLEIASIYDLYEQAMRAQRAVDFGDLIMRPALLLESDAALRTAVQLRHRHVLVDEYQDVNRASARLLKALAGEGKRLWVVGDARQSIYRFRGASSSNMAGFSTDYPGANVGQLSINYRSTPEVVRAFVAASTHMGASKGMLPLSLNAARASESAAPAVGRYEYPDDEAAGVAARIRELEATGVKLRDQAVLCRTNARLGDIAFALEARSIPVLHLGSLFEREEIRDLLALLSLAVDRFGDALVRVAAMPAYDLSLQDTYAVTRALREIGQPAIKSLSQVVGGPGVSVPGAAALARLVRDVDGVTASTPAWEFLSTYLLDRADVLRTLARAESVQERMRAVAIWQFLNFIREPSPIKVGSPIWRTLDRVRQLVLLAEERDLRQVPAAALHMNAVRLMTVHGSKGLEFEAVHIPGLTVANFPQSNRGQRCPPPVGMIDGADGVSVADEAKRAQEHEEQCLFFVALSRARTHLQLYLPRLQAGGKNRSASPFLDWLPAGILADVQQPVILPSPRGGRISPSISVNRPANWSITDSRLTLYQKCPRRFFYTHILGLGGGRKPTAFSRSNDCLYSLLEWLGDARTKTEPTCDEAEAAFEEIWKTRGPVDHAFAADYRRLASQLIGTLVRLRAGRRFREAQPLAVDFANGRVIVEPDEIAERPNGVVVLRRVRTGKKRGDEYDRLDYMLYQLAGEAHFGRSAVEATHLADEMEEEVPPLTATKLKNRRLKSEQMLADIAAGSFPTAPDAVTCPRCPHFFICAAAPRGAVSIE